MLCVCKSSRGAGHLKFSSKWEQFSIFWKGGKNCWKLSSYLHITSPNSLTGVSGGYSESVDIRYIGYVKIIFAYQKECEDHSKIQIWYKVGGIEAYFERFWWNGHKTYALMRVIKKSLAKIGNSDFLWPHWAQRSVGRALKASGCGVIKAQIGEGGMAGRQFAGVGKTFG